MPMLGLLVPLLALALPALRSACSGDLLQYTLCWVNYIVQCNVFHRC